MKKLLLTLVAFLALVHCNAQKTKITHIYGNVVNRDSDTLLLINKTKDWRNYPTKIPIIDGSFQYDLEYEHLQEYYLLFKDEADKGLMRRINFFLIVIL